MTHFILSLLFLPIIALLVVGYFYTGKAFFRYVYQLFCGIKKLSFCRSTFIPQRSVWFMQWSYLKKLLIVGLLCTLGLYVYERPRWIMDNSAHLSAKQYMVINAVILDYRTIGAALLFPENLIWKPLVWLQRLVVTIGRSLIPDNDGEHGIWLYYFELAPYINVLHAPATSEMYHLISTAEFTLQTLAEKEITDENFREFNQYQIYTITSFYYNFSYLKKYILDLQPKVYTEGLFHDPKQYEFIKSIVDKYIEKEQEWPQNPLISKYVKEHPDFELIHISTALLLVRNIIYYQINNRKYACNDHYVNIYYEYAERFYGDNTPYHKVDNDLQDKFWHVVGAGSRWENFFGHRLCDKPRLPAYSIHTLASLTRDSHDFLWDDAFIDLTKKLVPVEKQQDVLERIDLGEGTYNKTRRKPWKW